MRVPTSLLNNTNTRVLGPPSAAFSVYYGEGLRGNSSYHPERPAMRSRVSWDFRCPQQYRTGHEVEVAFAGGPRPARAPTTPPSGLRPTCKTVHSYFERNDTDKF
ncbi:hypothetical protein EVAR_85512_1 [Eumeta japonica]|uniref:Uncharacterized protein n=1 Tax=Eumeta variegata TaxID=151549 RepID=A0A4C1VE77_EUMVA|nr:hypothetical protein EVAR_85512_1 [Eumeta japonica]